MEKWDLYDDSFKKLDKVGIRGKSLDKGDYHLVVNAWIENDKGQFLISRRVLTKPHGGMWECTGGSALLGESAIDACVREIKEELGLDIDKSTARFVGMCTRYFVGHPDILRVYKFKSNESLSKVSIQAEEVMDAKWATKEEILQLCSQNAFNSNAFMLDVLNHNYEK